jgi:DNA repair exonuclease SbcCD ATPase subunit
LEKTILAADARHKVIAKVYDTIDATQRKITANHNEIQKDMREVGVLRREIADIETQLQIDNADKLQELYKRRESYRALKEEYLNSRAVLDMANIILRDSGIKSRIIKQYIPIINSLVNKYLAAMDFFVKFELNENFEEKILSRHRDEFTYDSFSEGEKMRIDLSLLFTWRTIARMKNSAATNLLILDEVFDASLDANGCEEFLKLIHSLEDANVFVISHKGDIMQDKFRSTIRFEKHKNFSRIAA